MWGPSRSQRQENTSKILSAAFVCEMHLLVGESLLGVEEYPTIKVLGTADQMVCFFKSLVYWDIIAEKCSLSKEKWNIFMIRNILHGFLFFFHRKECFAFFILSLPVTKQNKGCKGRKGKECENERKCVKKQKHWYLKIIVPVFTAGLKKYVRKKFDNLKEIKIFLIFYSEVLLTEN